ncbi:MAG TPA: hypothetical protein VMU30_06950 [Bacteroidota bacterium]|nr:hypothetical protein [Bacteroidota bacterium]
MKLQYFLLLPFILGNSTQLTKSDEPSEKQFVQIYFQETGDVLNTFDKTLRSGLVTGWVEIPFWLTKHEQDTILAKVEEIKFFTFPDTIKKAQNAFVQPYFGPKILRIKYKNLDKKIIWDYPAAKEYQSFDSMLMELQNLIDSIITSKEEYKKLPAPHQGYQ